MEAPAVIESRPRPLFFVVLLLGLFITFTFLLVATPAMMTVTKTEQELVVNVSSMRRYVKIALMADAGLNEASRMVLQMIRDENVDMVLHSGDLDYQGDADAFYKSVDDVLGPDFPYFATMGNYEAKKGMGRALAWEAYFLRQRERLKRIRGLNCAVVTMRQLACSYEGVSFVASAVGVNSSRLGLDVKELRAAQAALWGPSDTPFAPLWRFCSWHLPMADFQVGFREGVPWMSSPELLAAYESCRMRGAAVVTGHEHYYVRSHSVRRYGIKADDVEYKTTRVTVRSTGDNTSTVDALLLAPGASFAVVSGLGGHSVSVPSAQRIAENPHLAAIHPKYLIRDTDPNGKFFFPRITGKGDPTSSHRIEAVMDEREGYPFGALICTLQQAVTPVANGAPFLRRRNALDNLRETNAPFLI